jgi:hypothetical protein
VQLVFKEGKESREGMAREGEKRGKRDDKGYSILKPVILRS